MKTDRQYTILLAILLLVVVRTAGAQGPPEIQWMRAGSYYANQSCFSADGSRYAVADASGGVHIYRAADDMLLRRFYQPDADGVFGRSGTLSVALSADGSRVALGTLGRLTVRDVATGVIYYEFDGNYTQVGLPDCRYPSLSADGNVVSFIYGGNGNGVPAQVHVHVVSPAGDPLLLSANAFAWSTLSPVAGNLQIGVGLYAYDPFGLIRTFLVGNTPLCGAFSADGSRYASALVDANGKYQLIVGDTTGSGHNSAIDFPRLPTEAPHHWSNRPQAAAFAPDNQTCYVADAVWSLDETIKMCAIYKWDGASLTEYALNIPQANNSGAAFSPDATFAIFPTLLVGNRYFMYRVKGPDFSNPANTVPVPGHGNFVSDVAVSPDGTFAATASKDGTGCIWSVTAGEGHAAGDLVRTLNTGSINTIAISPDSKVVATGADQYNGVDSGNIRFWRVSDGALIGTVPGGTGAPPCNGVAFSPDGKFLAAAFNLDGVHPPCRMYSISRNGDDSSVTTSLLASWSGPAGVDPAFSPDGKLLAMGVGAVYHVDANGVPTLAHSHAWNGPAVFSPDSLTYAGPAVDTGNTIGIFSSATGALLKTLNGHTDRPNSVSFSPDGKFLLSSASGSAPGLDATLKIWDVSTGQVRKNYDMETGTFWWDGITSAKISPDGQSIVYGRRDFAVVAAAFPDLIPPVTTISVVGANVTLTATDNKSGVLATYYMLDGGAQQTYTAPFSAGLPGTHTVVYWSTDNAGNTEAQNTATFTVGIPVAIKVTGVTGQAGTKATVSATLKRSDTNVPLGSRILLFKLDGSTQGTKVTSATGTASLAINLPDTLGAHVLTAEFAGDPIYQPGAGTGTVTVTQANTTLAVTGVSTIIGKKTNLVAKLTRTTGGTTVSGKTVTFKVDGATVGIAVTSAVGIATVANYQPLSVGSFTLTAEFVGDASYAASSGSGSFTVAQSTTTLSVPNKSVKLGKAVILKAALKRTSDNGLLAGTPVTIKVDGVTVGTVFTDGSGTASVTYTATVAGGTGTKTISAAFDGDSSYFPSFATGTLTVIP